MRRVDAPRAGWYPDPEDRVRLRFWDGLDWTDVRRAPPSAAELASFEQQESAVVTQQYVAPVPSAAGRADSHQIVEDVRLAARGEIDRAAEMLARQTRAMQRQIEPIVSDYTNRIVKWIRFAAIVAVVLLVAYFLLQVIAQASLFDWIGDRIDNFTNDQNGAPITSGVRPAM